MEVDAGTIVGSLLMMLEVVVGVISSSFIVVVIGLEFIKQHQVITSNKLLIPLCFSAICFSIMVASNNVVGLVLPETSQLGYAEYVFNVLNMYSFSSCSWLTSCLCFFYFIKIVNFRSGCLTWTKMKIDSIVLWMVVVVEAVSLCGSSLNTLILTYLAKSTTNSSIYNNTTESEIDTYKYLNFIYMVNLLPFIVVMITTVMTIASLNLHIRKMGKRITSNTNLEVHRRVVWTMIQLLITYSIYYLVMFLLFFGNILSMVRWLYPLLMSMFTPIQAGILIQSNPKFMKTWKALYKSVSCFQYHTE